ncbi:hypothetical protein [Glacieibacterium frigidum]|uniref:Uncharacterized protein n=1 Tax=Glacieibacterium frigidum TaxID=2593303 RepID=A0A552U8L2_9SPHN|nr:hypothetical protein [Glacieibacterium frigidum]TRW14560.1 hypothetical protein FMM06_12745 [Glacieibacterium frigidum]
MEIDYAAAADPPARTPAWFWAAAGLGALWNAFGTVQFAEAVTATEASLIAMGMTPAQAATMTSYPLWMTMGFAGGTLGGLAGSLLLLARRRLAVPVFAASLAGYVVLYIGDITEGVFAALGTEQVVILTSVVLIAALLLWLARLSTRRGILG